MLEEHDHIVLTDDVADPGVKAGDVGTIVHVHRDAGAFEVEFLTLDGHTAAVATVPSSQVRPVTGADVTHARDVRSGAMAPRQAEPASDDDGAQRDDHEA